MRKLVIAEKPSVARSIAAVIGAEQKRNGYLEGNGYFVSWCVGHLVELAQASVYNTQYQKWRREDLPIIPNPWQYVVFEGTKQQFAILSCLMNAPDVESIICATDAGREGELVFRLVYEQCDCHKPVQRLWISSMEEAAIADGFRNLRPSADYDALYQAALCRARADWLVGINATRLYSTMYHQLLNIGRVMTPTLSMLVTREAKISAFQPMPFYTVRLDCGSLIVESQRIADHAEAEHIAALFINPDDCTNIRTTAKELKIPERKFVQFLLREKYLFRSPSGQLLPYNKDSNAGLFIVRDFVTYCYTGSQTYFTPKGKDVIRVKFQKKCAEELLPKMAR